VCRWRRLCDRWAERSREDHVRAGFAELRHCPNFVNADLIAQPRLRPKTPPFAPAASCSRNHRLTQPEPTGSRPLSGHTQLALWNRLKAQIPNYLLSVARKRCTGGRASGFAYKRRYNIPPAAIRRRLLSIAREFLRCHQAAAHYWSCLITRYLFRRDCFIAGRQTLILDAKRYARICEDRK
jgi:hypothetical protein